MFEQSRAQQERLKTSHFVRRVRPELVFLKQTINVYFGRVRSISSGKEKESYGSVDERYKKT